MCIFFRRPGCCNTDFAIRDGVAIRTGEQGITAQPFATERG